MTSWSRIVGRLAIVLSAVLLVGTDPLAQAVAAGGDKAAENSEEGDVGDWILRLFRGIGEDNRTPEPSGQGSAGTGGSPGGGTVGGDDDEGGDDDGGDDDGGSDDGGDDDGGDDGGGDDGGDDD